MIPMNEFRTILRALGINLSPQTLRRFLITKQPMIAHDLSTRPDLQPSSSSQINLENSSRNNVSIFSKRAKSSNGVMQAYGNGRDLKQSGVRGIGIDVQEFLKHYFTSTSNTVQK